jgi:hypothetical protein
MYTILGVEEIQMTFKAGFRLDLKWFDNRLTFINLKDSGNNVAKDSRDNVTISPLSFFRVTE